MCTSLEAISSQAKIVPMSALLAKHCSCSSTLFASPISSPSSELPIRRAFKDGKVSLSNPCRNRKSNSCRTKMSISEILTMSAIESTTIASGGYSEASYYTSLGLFLVSLPGLWSLIKRSTKSKIVQKTFVVQDPKSPSQIAGEVMSFFTRNNFTVANAGETITFEGIMVPCRGQAAFLTFCTCISLASVALVLTITFPDIGEKWYWLTSLSPLAGLYYWTRASRKEEIKVKMVVAEDETSTDVIVQGDDEQVDQLRRELKLMEKGMVYVKGLLER